MSSAISLYMGFPGASVVKNRPVNAVDARDVGAIFGSGRHPGEKKWQPIAVFLPGESHGKRSLAGYCP